MQDQGHAHQHTVRLSANLRPYGLEGHRSVPEDGHIREPFAEGRGIFVALFGAPYFALTHASRIAEECPVSNCEDIRPAKWRKNRFFPPPLHCYLAPLVSSLSILARISAHRTSQSDFRCCSHNVSASLISDGFRVDHLLQFSTVVSQWVLYQLAVRPEYLGPLREELSRVLEEDEDGSLRLTAASLREARLLDSFIREVMRLKGDTISTMRYTTCDVPLGNVIIPKGACVSVPRVCDASLRHAEGIQFHVRSGAGWLTDTHQGTLSHPCPQRCTRTQRSSGRTRAHSTGSNGRSRTRRRS